MKQLKSDPYKGRRLNFNSRELFTEKDSNDLTTIHSILNNTKRIKQLILQYYQIQNQLNQSV